VEFGPDLDSMIAFSARKGAVRVDLRSGKVRHLDPALYSYAGLAERYPERIRSRVTPDHRSFLNREDELVDIASGAKRPLRLEAPLGHPVVFLDPKQLVSLSPRGEFQWIELDPDRVTWTAPAFPEDEEAGPVRFDELTRKAPTIEVSPARNALYYEVADAHYVCDLSSGHVSRVAAAGRGTRFVAFSQEGDILCLRAQQFEGRYRVLLLVGVADGAVTPVSWAGEPIYISSSSDLAVTRDHPGLWGFHLTTPSGAAWQTGLSSHLAHVTADGSMVISAVGPVSRFSWSHLDPKTGPRGEKTVPLQSYRDSAGPPLLATDPRSQLAAWVMGLRVEVFRIRTLGTAKVESRIYDLEAAF
jgi:hypothetical protein